MWLPACGRWTVHARGMHPSPSGEKSPEAKGGSKGAPTPPGRPPRTPGAYPTRRPQLWPAVQGSSRFPRSLTGQLADWTPARFPAFSTGTGCVCRRRRRDVRNTTCRNSSVRQSRRPRRVVAVTTDRKLHKAIGNRSGNGVPWNPNRIGSQITANTAMAGVNIGPGGRVRARPRDALCRTALVHAVRHAR